MLDWTGERFVPWAREAAVAYEHLHRYIWASSLVTGKKVLDLASGEGYGAEILARRASFVCGVDIDEKAIARMHDLVEELHDAGSVQLRQLTLNLVLLAMGDALLGQQLARSLGLPRGTARDTAEAMLTAALASQD